MTNTLLTCPTPFDMLLTSYCNATEMTTRTVLAGLLTGVFANISDGKRRLRPSGASGAREVTLAEVPPR